MPVQKFRSVEDMPPVPSSETVEDRFRRIAKLWARASAWSGMVYPRGVFKFRTLEEAQAARERVTQENVDRLRQQRERSPVVSAKDRLP
ncbi:MAG TPA: hypothetical protein VF173_37835 [Thermoanaerobaculia bacterium]|nr:hypothetical protein [Thermoanaerobaculia bacterium]